MKQFSKRALSCFILMCLMLVICGVRVFIVATDEELSAAAVKQATKLKTISGLRGTVYDVNGVPITNTLKKWVTVIFPTEKGAIAAGEILSGEQLDSVLKTLRNGTPAVVDGKMTVQSEGAVTLQVPVRYNGTLQHVIGYIDGSGHGVAGIEKGFDSVLYSQNGIGLSYTTDSGGRMIEGMGWSIETAENIGSVTLTVDSRLQAIAERAMTGVEAGAAVIMHAETGEIRAMVSVPDFSAYDVAGSLSAPNSPFINRALCSYNVGSVFKPIIAAAAIESGLSDYRYNCKGSVEIDGKEFRCNSHAGHGEIDLETALAKSCNTYFYTLAMKLGADLVYDMSSRFKFDSMLDLAGGITVNNGNLPNRDILENSRAALINLSIGQGDLMITPVTLSLLYSAIINGGEYTLPKIVKSYVQDGKEVIIDSLPPTLAISSTTADILKEYLKTALKSGTGSSAYVEGIDAGGKTGTAQTGWKDEDRSILNGWFCGFYEGNSPYVITVLKEDVKSGSADCAPIFKSIIEEMKILQF